MKDEQCKPVSVLEFETFSNDADKLFTEIELEDLHYLLAHQPEIGRIIPGTGGVRKLRFGLEKKGKGKLGGARVIYYFHNTNTPIALIAVYAKTEKIDIPVSEKKELRNIIDTFVSCYKNS